MRQAITKLLTVLAGVGRVRDVRRGRERIWELEPDRLAEAHPKRQTMLSSFLSQTATPAVPAREFQNALFEAGIPATSFAVDDVPKEYERLKAWGVTFTGEPTTTEGVTVAVLDDTRGNLILIAAA